MERNRRREAKGIVVSDRMQKTIKVEMATLVKHPRYGKYVRRISRVLAHDAEGKAKEGDVVQIMESRPVSKRKQWRLVKVIRSAPE